MATAFSKPSSVSPSVEPLIESAAPASFPLYVAGLIVIMCGLFSINIVLDDAAFANLTIGMAFIGWLVSYISRKQNVSPRSIQIPAGILMLMLAVIAVASDQVLPFLSPPGLGDDRQKALAVLMTWGTVFLSFLLITDDILLFACVPTLAMMGLAGTMTAETPLITSFILFVCAASFMSVHENFLRTRRRYHGRPRPGAERRLFANQLQVTAVCGIGAMILANIVAVPMSQIGSRLILAPAMMSQGSKNSNLQSATVVRFAERTEVAVGQGPVKLSNEVVMHVRADHGSYWRGATFNMYTGRGWRNTFAEPEEHRPDHAQRQSEDILSDPDPGANGFTFSVPRTLYNRTGAGSQLFTQRITLTGNSMFMEVYAAPEARVVQLPADILRTDEIGSVHVNRPLQQTQYTVESEIADSSPERLRKTDPKYPDQIRRQYMSFDQIRPDALARLKETAESVTKDSKTIYDKVESLRDWISKECKYNLDAPAVAPDVDVTEDFLFHAKQGYCDSFATALAMLCRSIGIPARVASGFAPGTLDRNSQEYFVHERDKHLWTEVYFTNIGWISFDATEGSEDISSSDANKNGKRSAIMAFLFGRGILPPLTLLVFLVMLGYVVKVEILDRIRRPKAAENPLGLPANNMLIVEAYGAAIRLLDKRGLKRLPHSTPGEFLQEVQARLTEQADVVTSLTLLTSLLVAYRYGRVEAGETDVELSKQALETLRCGLKAKKLVVAAAPIAAESRA